jgi:hypothetical protein
MDIALELEGQELYSAQIELLIKILAIQKATVSFVCDKFSKTENESDEYYNSVMDDANQYGRQIFSDLYERRGKINLDDVLGKK